VSRTAIARRLLALLRPMAGLMTVSAGARVINQGLGVAIPAVAGAGVIGFITNSSVWSFALILVVMSLAKGSARYIEQFTAHAVAFRLLSRLRVDTYRHAVPLAPADLEDERTGDLVARVIGDIDRVEPFYAHTIGPVASAITVPVLAAIGLAIFVDPIMGAIFLPFPLLMVSVVPWARARRVGALSTSVREQSGELSAVFTDSIQGAREVAVFGADETVKTRLGGLTGHGSAIRRELARVSAVRTGLNDLIAGAAVVLVGLAGLSRFDTGVIDLAGLAAAITVSWVGTTPARALEQVVPDLEEALAAASRLFDLADREPSVSEPVTAVGRPEDASVAFENVGVAYPRSDIRALDQIDATIEEGSYVAVVGPSGSGKSTLVELLPRFRDPSAGRVVVGGVDVSQMGSADLRRHVTLVPQRPDIFFGTLADNLLLARPDAGEDELWNALERAALGDWARSLERGLESTIGELGETMSGGERQRLAIARVFLRDPSVLILDEATSQLDPATEAEVLGQIARERGKRTVIVVAHRLETVIHADQILVLDRASLVERGTHAQLLDSEGVYARLWQRHLDVVAEPA
jgi:ATP-binding cassette, subfamily C, bacterial CydC